MSVSLVIGEVYMPTSPEDDDEIGKIYGEIEELIKYVRGEENLMLIGDWNAIVGERKKGILQENLD